METVETVLLRPNISLTPGFKPGVNEKKRIFIAVSTALTPIRFRPLRMVGMPTAYPDKIINIPVNLSGLNLPGLT